MEPKSREFIFLSYNNIDMPLLNNTLTPQEVDYDIIPEDIFNETLAQNTEFIENYFILHPAFLYSFVGYNGALKLANQLNSDLKCGCFYNLPWKTHYDTVQNVKNSKLSFSQQVVEYRYMISHMKDRNRPVFSYMQYLSNIALTMILDINLFLTYRANNLYYCNLSNKPYYKNNFKNDKQFHVFILTHYPSLLLKR